MATLVMPVVADTPAYDFDLELEQVLYKFSFRYNERMDRWLMDIRDQNDVPILLGTVLITNYSLIERFKSASLPPGEFFVLDEAGNKLDAIREALGNDNKLFYVESA